jgi:hypothetical protein
MRSTNLVTLLSIVLAGALGGCAANGNLYDPHGYLSRSDAIDMSAGDANASNIAIQMVDPWPAYAGNKTIAYNGSRMQAAVQRYRENRVTPPQGMSPSGVYGQSSPSTPSTSSGGAPVGPTVTQTH